jgi:uncharacterized protein (TIGR03067 family)
MKYLAPLIAVCFFLLVANAAQDDLAKKDLDRLQGVWRLTSLVSDGKPIPEKDVKGVITIKANKWIEVDSGGTTVESTIKLDPSKKLKAIDITPLSGHDKGLLYLGIYSIEGDTLKIYVKNAGGDTERPNEFKAVRNVNLLVLQREKR